MTIRIDALHRYPVKGLSPEAVTQFRLETGGYVPGDRVFAIENGPSGFDAADPRHKAKTHYLMLMRNEALARLRSRYDDATDTLVIEGESGARIEAPCGDPEGARAIAAFVAQHVPDLELRGDPALLTAPPGFRFTDSRTGYVSLINLASVAAVETMTGAAVDPLRFRGNVHMTGLPAWGEFDLVGKVLEAPSGLRLEVTGPIVRCAATNVDPSTGLRDLTIPQALMRHLGHMDCGIYAKVIAPGSLAAGAHLAVADEDGGGRLPF
ncbi:MAG: MOSC domain-containing protein [Salinarimonas sp.]|nr:MOSC domain-containing protein [Salinarimonas sp.]